MTTPTTNEIPIRVLMKVNRQSRFLHLLGAAVAVVIGSSLRMAIAFTVEVLYQLLLEAACLLAAISFRSCRNMPISTPNRSSQQA
jgi:hypothetical protein